MTYSAQFEWRQAAKFGGYTYREFMRLDGEEQSWIVAHYRLSQQADAVVAREQEKEIKRKSRASKSKPPH